MTIHKTSLCALLLCFALHLLGQNASLDTVRQAVSFETEQKELLKLTAIKLQDEYKLLGRMHVDDEQILRVFKLLEDLNVFIRQIDDANNRQALLSEQIKQITDAQKLSQQESRVYRTASLKLTELAHVQGQLFAVASQQRRNLNLFLQSLPPPTTMKLSKDLTFTLVKNQGRPFYASSLVMSSDNPQKPLMSIDYNQATQIARDLSRLHMLPLTLPTQLQIEAMSLENVIPQAAIWSQDIFATKNSLKFSKARPSHSKLTKTELTPAQINAMNRFKMTFQLIWDPQHKLGKQDFLKEIHIAKHDCLGMILIAPAHVGARQRLEALKKQYENNQIQAIKNAVKK